MSDKMVNESRWGIIDNQGRLTVLSWLADEAEAQQVARNWDEGCETEGPHIVTFVRLSYSCVVPEVPVTPLPHTTEGKV